MNEYHAEYRAEGQAQGPAGQAQGPAPTDHSYEDEPLPRPAPGKSSDAAPLLSAAAREYMGAVRVTQRGVVGELDLDVYVQGLQIEVGPFQMAMPEALALAASVMDACQSLVRMPERWRVMQELDDLTRECEEAPV